MRTIQGARASWLVGALGACLLTAGAARADIATERPGSILIFPKVVRDGTRDTAIQISNTGNMVNCARCFYLDAQASENGGPICEETDFQICLTKQQPTVWDVDEGRKVYPFDEFGQYGSGLDPGLIPPAPQGFTGALICVEVDSNGVPVAQNKLKGEATIFGETLPIFSRYNGIALTSGDSSNLPPANKLDLNGHEYAQCPDSHRLNFIPDGGNDPVIEQIGNGGRCENGPPGAGCNNDLDCPGISGPCITGLSSVVTNLTVLPCNLDLQNGLPTTVSLTFAVHDEFETMFSGSTTVDCWSSFSIGGIPALRSTLQTGGDISTQYATAQFRSTSGGPVVAVAEVFHSDAIANTATAAENLHMVGVGSNATIRIADE